MPALSKDQLISFYIDRHLSDREIADLTGNTRKQIKDWRKRYGIKGRSPIMTRFPDRIHPSKAELAHLYQTKYLSAEAIAVQYEVDPSAVRYWMRKYGIPSRSVWETRRKGKYIEEPTKSELYHLYHDRQLNMNIIGDMFKFSAHAISIRMDKFGIPKRPSAFHGRRLTCQDGHVVMSGLEAMTDDWLYERHIPHIYNPNLPFSGRADFLIKETFVDVWGMTHNTRYSRRRESKLEHYKAHNLLLIELFPKDIPCHLHEKLAHFIS